jgi:hypothetical protein
MQATLPKAFGELKSKGNPQFYMPPSGLYSRVGRARGRQLHPRRHAHCARFDPVPRRGRSRRGDFRRPMHGGPEIPGHGRFRRKRPAVLAAENPAAFFELATCGRHEPETHTHAVEADRRPVVYSSPITPSPSSASGFSANPIRAARKGGCCRAKATSGRRQCAKSGRCRTVWRTSHATRPSPQSATHSGSGR